MNATEKLPPFDKWWEENHLDAVLALNIDAAKDIARSAFIGGMEFHPQGSPERGTPCWRCNAINAVTKAVCWSCKAPIHTEVAPPLAAPQAPSEAVRGETWSAAYLRALDVAKKWYGEDNDIATMSLRMHMVGVISKAFSDFIPMPESDSIPADAVRRLVGELRVEADALCVAGDKVNDGFERLALAHRASFINGIATKLEALLPTGVKGA